MDDERPIEELVSKGTEYLKRLLATPKEDLAKDLYIIDKLVSNRRSASLQNIQELFKSVYEDATEAMQQSDFERSAVRMLYILYEAYFYNDIPDDISSMLTHALNEAGGMPVEKASEILYDTLDDIMEGNISAKSPAGTPASPINDAAAQMMQQASAAAAEMQKKMMEKMSGSDIAELQQKMTEAMARGDMQEYMRLAGELQQKMMNNLFN